MRGGGGDRMRRLRELGELRRGCSRVDVLLRDLQALLRARHNAGHVQREGVVERDEVPARALIAAFEDVPDDRRVERRVATLDVVEGRSAETEVLWRHLVALDTVALDLGDRRRTEDRDLVEPVHAVSHDHVLHVELRDGVADQVDVVGPVDAQQVAGSAGGIDQRADDREEDGLDAERLLREEDLEHQRMEVRRVQEADADLLDEAAALVGLQLDAHAEGFERIGGAGRRRDRTAAVLRDRCAGRGREDRVRRRDIERRQAAACPAHVRQRTVDLRPDLHTVVSHRAGDGSHFVDRRALHDERHEKARDLRVGDRVVAHVLDELRHLGVRQALPLRQLGE